jgi:hypothetical protein
MACFWEGILSLLDTKEINKILKKDFKTKPHPKKFVKALKKYNKYVNDIKHNNMPLTQIEIKENFNRIASISPNESGNGYLCSGFEPVFFLISHLFGYNIKHVFCEHLILYDHQNSKGELVFGSNSTHFYSIQKKMF